MQCEPIERREFEAFCQTMIALKLLAACLQVPSVHRELSATTPISSLVKIDHHTGHLYIHAFPAPNGSARRVI